MTRYKDYYDPDLHGVNDDEEENEDAYCLNCKHSELIDRTFNIVNCKLLNDFHNGYCVCDNFEEVKE